MMRAGFESELADDERNWHAQVNLGLALLELGDRARALRCLRRAIELAPDDADAHFRLAQALGEGEADAARAELETTLRLAPDHAEATSALAAAAAARGDAAEAVRLYRRAIALRPVSYPARAGLAALLEKRGELDEAAQHLEVALNVETTAAAPRRELADLERRRGRAAAAVAQYRKLLWLGPDPAAQRWLAWLLATAPDDAVRDGRQALEFARALLDRGGDDAAVLDTLAAAQAESHRFKAALETAERAQQRANAVGDAALADAIGRRIESYRAGKAWRDPPAAR
jgi:tetratricopeptide (TPR) repeat protein